MCTGWRKTERYNGKGPHVYILPSHQPLVPLGGPLLVDVVEVKK